MPAPAGSSPLILPRPLLGQPTTTWSTKPPFGTPVDPNWLKQYQPSLLMPFNEGQGNTAYDLSLGEPVPNGNNGTLNGAASLNAGQLQLSSSSSYASVPNISPPLTGFTLFGVITPTTVDGNYRAAVYRAGRQIWIGLSGGSQSTVNSLVFFPNSTDQGTAYSQQVLVAGTTYRFVLVWNGSIGTMYLNGVPGLNGSGNFSMSTGSGNLLFGRDTGNNFQWIGTQSLMGVSYSIWSAAQAIAWSADPYGMFAPTLGEQGVTGGTGGISSPSKKSYFFIDWTPPPPPPTIITVPQRNIGSNTGHQRALFPDRAVKPAFGTPVNPDWLRQYRPSLLLPFNEGQGNTAYDLSLGKPVPNANNGTLNGGVAWANGGLKLDGTSTAYVGPISSASLNNWTSLSIRVRFRASVSQPQFTRLIEKGATNEWCLNVGEVSAGKISGWSGSGTNFVTSTNALIDGVTHDVVFTISPTYALSLYVDGVLNATASGLTPAAKTAALNIGRYGGGGFNFNGVIYDVTILPILLSASQILSLSTDPYGWAAPPASKRYFFINAPVAQPQNIVPLSLPSVVTNKPLPGVAKTGTGKWFVKPPFGTPVDPNWLKQYQPSLLMPFNEQQGNTAYDLSLGEPVPNGNNGTLNGGVTWSGGNLKLDGATGYILGGFNKSASYPVSIWCIVTPTNTTALTTVIGLGNASNSNGCTIRQHSTLFGALSEDGGGNIATVDSLPVTVGTPQLLMAVFRSKTNRQLYKVLNGVVTQSSVDTTNSNVTLSALTSFGVGHLVNINSGFFGGTVAQAGVAFSDLSPFVLSLYTDPYGMFAKNRVSIPVPVPPPPVVFPLQWQGQFAPRPLPPGLLDVDMQNPVNWDAPLWQGG